MSKTIDWPRFREACEDARYRWENYTADEKRVAGGVYHFYRCEMSEHDFEIKAPISKSTARSLEDIKNELFSAAQNTGRYGASAAQIDLIAALAVKAGERNRILGGGRLTKFAATEIINSYKRG